MRYLIIPILLSFSLSASLLDFSYLGDAKKAYEAKEYTKAGELYSQVEGDEAKFNQADALYREKKYKEAIEAYESISDPKLEAKKLHNIGNSYAQMKKIDKAIESYEKALNIADDEDTKFNLELLKKKKKEQEKKKQDKNKDQKKKDDKEKDKDKKDQKQDDKNKSDQDKKDKQKSEEEKRKEQEKKDQAKKEEEKRKQQAQMAEQNKTQPPISNMEERKWQKMLNQKGVNTLMIPLNKGAKQNETNPW